MISKFCSAILVVGSLLGASTASWAQGNDSYDRNSFKNITDSVFNKAVQAYSKGDSDEALKILKTINSGSKKYVEVLNGIINLEIQNNNLPEVTTYTNQLRTFGPASIRNANYYDAVVKISNEDYKGALALLDENLSLTQVEDVQSMIYKALCLQLLGDNEAAEKLAEQAGQLYFSDQNLHVLLGNIYAKQGRLAEAFLAYNMAFFFSKDYGTLVSTSGHYNDLLWLTGDIKDAYLNKRKNKPNEFSQIDEYIFSMVRDTTKQQKVSLDDAQFQAILKKVKYNPSSTNFAMQTYLPSFQNALKKGPDPFLMLVYSKVDNDFREALLKNTKQVERIDLMVADLNTDAFAIGATRELNYKKRLKADKEYLVGYNVPYFYKTDYVLQKLSKPIPSKVPIKNLDRMVGLLYIDGFLYMDSRNALNADSDADVLFYKKYSTEKDRVIHDLEKGKYNVKYFGVSDMVTDSIVYLNDKKIYESVSSDFGIPLSLLDMDSNGLVLKQYFPNGVLNNELMEDFKTGSVSYNKHFNSGKLKETSQESSRVRFMDKKIYNKFGQLKTEVKLDTISGAFSVKEFEPNGTLKSYQYRANVTSAPSIDSTYKHGKLQKVESSLSYAILVGEQKYWNEEGKQYGYVAFDESGNVLNGYFLGPKADTIWTYKKGAKTIPFYDENGVLIREFGLTGGQLNGIVNAYYINGALKSEVDENVNNEESFYSNGKSMSRIDSVENSNFKSYISYSPYGKVVNKMTLLNYRPNGERESYYTNGLIKDKGFFNADDVENGDFYYYDTKGRLRYMVTYKNGVVLKINTYNLKGDIVKTQQITAPNGNLDVFDANNQKVAQFGRENGLFLGDRISYYENGQVRNKSYYLGGRNVMLNLEYYPDGKFKSKLEFRNGRLEKREEFMLGNVLDDVYDYSTISDSSKHTSYLLEPQMLFVSYSDGDDNTTQYYTIGKDTALVVHLNEYLVVSYATFDKTTGKWTNKKVTAKDTVMTAYNKARQKIASVHLDKQSVDGSMLLYANGKVIYDLYSKDGQEISKSKVYYPSGQLRYEYTRKDGLDFGPSRYYDEKGKLLIEAHFEEDQLLGEYKFWDAKSQTYKSVNVDYNIFPELDQVY